MRISTPRSPLAAHRSPPTTRRSPFTFTLGPRTSNPLPPPGDISLIFKLKRAPPAAPSPSVPCARLAPPCSVADMSRFPLLRIGDTFEMEFDLASNTNEVGTNFDDQWRLQPAAEHAAFGTALRHHFSPVSRPFLAHFSPVSHPFLTRFSPISHTCLSPIYYGPAYCRARAG